MRWILVRHNWPRWFELFSSLTVNFLILAQLLRNFFTYFKMALWMPVMSLKLDHVTVAYSQVNRSIIERIIFFTITLPLVDSLYFLCCIFSTFLNKSVHLKLGTEWTSACLILILIESDS
jgi:hypothetical protein